MENQFKNSPSMEVWLSFSLTRFNLSHCVVGAADDQKVAAVMHHIANPGAQLIIIEWGVIWHAGMTELHFLENQ